MRDRCFILRGTFNSIQSSLSPFNLSWAVTGCCLHLREYAECIDLLHPCLPVKTADSTLNTFLCQRCAVAMDPQPNVRAHSRN